MPRGGSKGGRGKGPRRDGAAGGGRFGLRLVRRCRLGRAVALGCRRRGLAALGVTWYMLVFLIARPVTTLVTSMRRIATGDTSTDVPNLGRANEVGDMARAVQVFKEKSIENQRLQAEEAKRSAELAAARPYWLGQHVALIGDDKLCKAYADALGAQGLPVTAFGQQLPEADLRIAL